MKPLPWYGLLPKSIRGWENICSAPIQVGNQRTPTQDVEYAINQLVEVAVRAMSPAINDPFTAMTCLDYLADGLSLTSVPVRTSPNFYDQHGKLRLIFEPANLVELLGRGL